MIEGAGVRRVPTGISGFDQVAIGGTTGGSVHPGRRHDGQRQDGVRHEFLARGIRVRRARDVRHLRGDARGHSPKLRLLWLFRSAWEADGQWAFIDASHSRRGGRRLGAYDLGALVARIEQRSAGSAPAACPWTRSARYSAASPAAIIRRELLQDRRRTGRRWGSPRSSRQSGAREYEACPDCSVEEFVLDNVIVLRNASTRSSDAGPWRSSSSAVPPTARGNGSSPSTHAKGSSSSRSRSWATRQNPHPCRVSSGIAELDQMCGGGFFKDAIVLLTGPSGCGKTLTA